MPDRDPAPFPVDAADVARPWLASYPPLVPESYPYPPVPLTRLLDDAAKDFPDSTAVDFVGATLSYRLLLDHVDRFATALQQLGIAKGDRVGLAMPNCPQHVVAFFAVLRIGGIVVGLDPAADRRVLAAQINDAGCRALVLVDPVYTKIEQLKGRIPTVAHVIGTAVADYLPTLAGVWFSWRHRRNTRMVHRIAPAEGVLRFRELVQRHAPAVAHVTVDPDDAAVLAYGERRRTEPRAVVLTHRNVLANVFQMRLWIPDVQAGRETILCAVPFWRPYGMTTGLGLGVLGAATMALAPATDSEQLIEAIAKRKPTLFPATAALVERLTSVPNLRKHDLSSLRVALCDTSVLGQDIVEAFEESTGGRLREGLGLDEASPMTHANPVYGRAKAGSVGLPLSDTVCVLLDPDDPERVMDTGRGHLAVHGPQVSSGYWRRQDETDERVRDGWLLTGLLAEIDEDGYCSVLGRVGGAGAHATAAPAER